MSWTKPETVLQTFGRTKPLILVMEAMTPTFIVKILQAYWPRMIHVIHFSSTSLYTTSMTHLRHQYIEWLDFYPISVHRNVWFKLWLQSNWPCSWATEKKDMLENTVVVVSADNGGAIDAGSNCPLKGCKMTFFEGGVRALAFATTASQRIYIGIRVQWCRGHHCRKL